MLPAPGCSASPERLVIRRELQWCIRLCISCGRELETLAGAPRVMRAVEKAVPPRDYSAVLSQTETAGPDEGKKI